MLPEYSRVTPQALPDACETLLCPFSHSRQFFAFVKSTTHPGSTSDLDRTVSEKLIPDWEVNEVSLAFSESHL